MDLQLTFRHVVSCSVTVAIDERRAGQHAARGLLRLRCEHELGFKMVKWIAAIEFVDSFAGLGASEGGYNEDHEFYGYRMPI
jgi:DMSO/TMAO reductase YedYZ molybdopterin-dependent catalytic subunit